MLVLQNRENALKAIVIGTIAGGFSGHLIVADELAETIVAGLRKEGMQAEALDINDPRTECKDALVDPDGKYLVVIDKGLGGGFTLYGPFADSDDAEEAAEELRGSDEEWEIFSFERSTGSKERFTEILQHRIKFWLRGEDAPEELDGASVEHIEKLIKDEYHSGELCVVGSDGSTEYRGWWSIEQQDGTAEVTHAEALQALKADGLTIGECVDVLAAPDDDPYVRAARDSIVGDDDVQIDAKTVTSQGDNGAWVLSWMWVSNGEAGIDA